MSVGQFLTLGAVAICAFGGGAAFKHYTVVREPIWLIAGFVAYNASNVFWIALIDQAGLARAAVVASAAQIIFATAFGALWGERIGAAGYAATVLACLAVSVASIGSATNSEINSTSPSHLQETKR